jgi:hypothetical protein
MSLGVPAVSVGDKFPTTPVVHVGFPKAKTIAELLEGKSKVLFVSLPAHSPPPDPRARSRDSRRPKSTAGLRRRGSIRSTSSASTTAR